MKLLNVAIPSKGRLMEQANEVFERAGLKIERFGTDRGYRGRLVGIDNIEIAFLSASEIATQLRDGKIDGGITGEDLLRETISPGNDVADVALRLNFGAADVVVAVPECWLDVAVMADLDDVADEVTGDLSSHLNLPTKRGFNRGRPRLLQFCVSTPRCRNGAGTKPAPPLASMP